MARFHPLTVTNVRKTTRDAVEVTFDLPDSGEFSFIQGQYLTFRREFKGTEIRRSYSICAGAHEGCLKVGIKRVEGGVFSTWANEELAPGTVVESMPPMGNFHAPISPDARKHYLGFAAGSGITPVLSILKTVLAKEPMSRFTLVYANRAPQTIMFREEIEDLKNEHLDRLSVMHVLSSGATDIELFRGRLNEAKCAELFNTLIDVGSVDMSLICGPEPMMLSISAALKNHGLDNNQIKFELFAATQPGRLELPVARVSAGAAAGSDATAIIDGDRLSFRVENGTTVLQAALASAIDVPYACTVGVCSTCRCKLSEGEVQMISNHALEDYEVDRGYILSCQSLPLTERLVVDYDQH